MSRALGKEAFLPVDPRRRLIAYFPEGKQSCEAASFSQDKAPIRWLLRSRNSLPVNVIAAKARVNGPIARKESSPDKNAYFDGKLGRSRRVGKILLSSFLTERPLCQEAGPSINSRLQTTIMVTIWRGRASVRATTWESSGPVSISASRVEIGPGPSLGRK
jgi:hypothetical protein